MSEEEKQPVPISVVALRAESYAADGNVVVISLQTKYSTAERQYAVPIECFHDLIVDLHRLNSPEASDQSEPLLPMNMPEAAE